MMVEFGGTGNYNSPKLMPYPTTRATDLCSNNHLDNLHIFVSPVEQEWLEHSFLSES